MHDTVSTKNWNCFTKSWMVCFAFENLFLITKSQCNCIKILNGNDLNFLIIHNHLNVQFEWKIEAILPIMQLVSIQNKICIYNILSF